MNKNKEEEIFLKIVSNPPSDFILESLDRYESDLKTKKKRKLRFGKTFKPGTIVFMPGFACFGICTVIKSTRSLTSVMHISGVTYEEYTPCFVSFFYFIKKL